MVHIRRHIKLVGVAACCVALGAGAGAIATAGAASSTPSAGTTPTAAAHKRAHPLLARAVHGDLVVATRNGYATITLDRGFVQAVNGQQLTLREGTKATSYKTVTLTIPTSARVRVNRQLSTLSAVKPGMRASVLQAPKRTFVVARSVL